MTSELFQHKPSKKSYPFFLVALMAVDFESFQITRNFFPGNPQIFYRVTRAESLFAGYPRYDFSPCRRVARDYPLPFYPFLLARRVTRNYPYPFSLTLGDELQSIFQLRIQNFRKIFTDFLTVPKKI